VRAGAGSNYPLVTKLEAGTGGIGLGTKRATNGPTTWQEITVHGHTGWVNADYIARESQTAPESPGSPSPAESSAIASEASEEIQNLLAKEPIAMVFTSRTLRNGAPILTGMTKDGLAIVELEGPTTRLTSVACHIQIGDFGDVAAMRNAAILLTVLKKALPAWSNSADWYNTAFKKIAAGKTEDVSTTFGKANVVLRYVKPLYILTLAISSPSPSASPGTR